MSEDLNVVVTAGHHFAAERVNDRSLEELIFASTSAAIAKAGLTPAQIDSVVISGNDQTDGRIISCMVTTGAVAGVGKNVTTVASGPEHAFAYAVMRLLAGQGSNVLGVGWSKPSESVHPEHAELVSADPFYVRPIGMNRQIAAALQASVDAGPPDAGTDYLAWPLVADPRGAHADGVCALHVPHQPIFERPDGLLSGPVFMAAADVAMWLAIMTRTGIIDRLVTVEMKTNFLAGSRGADVTCTATVLRLGKRLIYGTAECRDPSGVLLTHHTLTYIRP